jgi:hypothetical protein
MQPVTKIDMKDTSHDHGADHRESLRPRLKQFLHLTELNGPMISEQALNPN